MRIRRIEHLAIAVENIDVALDFFRDVLDLEVSSTDIEEGQRVVVAFMPVGGSEIELIEPVDDDSGVARFLQQRGPGIHHICLEVEDLDEALAKLRDKNIRLVDRDPYVGSKGRRLAFIHPKAAHGVLIELYEEHPGDRRIPRVQDIDDLRRKLVVRSRVAAAGTRGFFAGLWGNGEPDGS